MSMRLQMRVSGLQTILKSFRMRQNTKPLAAIDQQYSPNMESKGTDKKDDPISKIDQTRENKQTGIQTQGQRIDYQPDRQPLGLQGVIQQMQQLSNAYQEASHTFLSRLYGSEIGPNRRSSLPPTMSERAQRVQIQMLRTQGEIVRQRQITKRKLMLGLLQLRRESKESQMVQKYGSMAVAQIKRARGNRGQERGQGENEDDELPPKQKSAFKVKHFRILYRQLLNLGESRNDLPEQQIQTLYLYGGKRTKITFYNKEIKGQSPEEWTWLYTNIKKKEDRLYREELERQEKERENRLSEGGMKPN